MQRLSPWPEIVQRTQPNAVSSYISGLYGSAQTKALVYKGSSDPLSILSKIPVRDKDVSTVIGGCEFPLALLHGQPASLQLFDICPISALHAELRLQALRTLSHDEWLEAFSAPKNVLFTKTTAIRERIWPLLVTATRAGLDDFLMRDIPPGILNERSGKYIAPTGIIQDSAEYSELQDIARQTPITIKTRDVRAMAPVNREYDSPTNLLYMSNIGIINQRIRAYARLMTERFARVFCTLHTEGPSGEWQSNKVWQPEVNAQPLTPGMILAPETSEMANREERIEGWDAQVSYPILMSCQKHAQVETA